MSIVDGYKKVKRYIQTDDGHELMSQWTSSDTVEIDGKTLTETLTTKADLDSNGQVKLEQIPKVALDNLVKVKNDTARFALTTDTVQTGDTVLVTDTERMYLVVDDTKLDNEDGYIGYSASTTWETIEGKPDNLTYISEDSEEVTIESYVELTRNDIVDDLITEDSTKVLSANQGKVLNDKVEEASNIAKGRNRAHVFSTTEAMQTWLSDEANKGLYNVGDNLYIVDVDVPDWWISAVLDTADASTGYYYNIAQLETQKVDLTEIENDIATINSNLNSRATLTHETTTDLPTQLRVSSYLGTTTIETRGAVDVATLLTYTLPKTFRPLSGTNIPCFIIDDNNDWYMGLLTIGYAGTFNLYKVRAYGDGTDAITTGKVYFNASYPSQ